VFLHGYLESSESWNDFVKLFADEYYVVCIDLPGHGKSAILSENMTMEIMANAVIEICDELRIHAFNLVGHSMGGYVSLELIKNYPDRLNTVVLLHSHCFADSDEKKANRDREIELVRAGKKDLIVNSNIPRLYANHNHETFVESIKNSKKIALQTHDSGIIAALNAMKSRTDKTELLMKTSVPVLLIGGKHDNLIPFEAMEKIKKQVSLVKLVALENSGHMGFIEEKDKTAKEMKLFFDVNFECF
jgi:pimeloyl-ACP methyl ester carboxylesterase